MGPIFETGPRGELIKRRGAVWYHTPTRSKSPKKN
jgi:hypothetical protein